MIDFDLHRSSIVLLIFAVHATTCLSIVLKQHQQQISVHVIVYVPLILIEHSKFFEISSICTSTFSTAHFQLLFLQRHTIALQLTAASIIMTRPSALSKSKKAAAAAASLSNSTASETKSKPISSPLNTKLKANSPSQQNANQQQQSINLTQSFSSTAPQISQSSSLNNSQTVYNQQQQKLQPSTIQSTNNSATSIPSPMRSTQAAMQHGILPSINSQQAPFQQQHHHQYQPQQQLQHQHHHQTLHHSPSKKAQFSIQQQRTANQPLPTIEALLSLGYNNPHSYMFNSEHMFHQACAQIDTQIDLNASSASGANVASAPESEDENIHQSGPTSASTNAASRQKSPSANIALQSKHSLPLARIKKIMKSDQDVRMISAEVPILFAKACEVLICDLTIRGFSHSDLRQSRTLQRCDVVNAIHSCDYFDFLEPLMIRTNHIDDQEEGTPTRLTQNDVEDLLLMQQQQMQQVLQQQQQQISYAANHQQQPMPNTMQQHQQHQQSMQTHSSNSQHANHTPVQPYGHAPLSSSSQSHQSHRPSRSASIITSSPTKFKVKLSSPVKSYDDDNVNVKIEDSIQPLLAAAAAAGPPVISPRRTRGKH
jgi:hypothetical protein